MLFMNENPKGISQNITYSVQLQHKYKLRTFRYLVLIYVFILVCCIYMSMMSFILIKQTPKI